tara:strand:+ start:343 stop:1560 length:1218 start_codon:yes stop_codon:yes gene_type:complete
MGDYLTEYENNNKKSSTKKKKSSRTKTPAKKTTKKAKTSKKKATPKPKKSSTKKKQRTKTPPPSSSRGKKTKKAESESEDEDAEEEANDAVIAYANSNAGKHTSNNDNDTSASLFGSSIFYWSGPYIFFSAIVLYTMLFFADEYKFPCITDKDATTTCDQQKATFILYIEWLQIIASGLAPLIAYFGIMKHPQSNNTLFSKKIATGVVWFFAFIALPFCTVANKDHVRLVKWATQSCNIMSSVSFTMAFMSSSDYSSVKPTWNVKRVLPFCIIGYYLFTELFRSGSSDNSIQPGLLRVHYEQMETDSISFVLFALEIAVPLLLGWAAASRVGYGGIEWRSLRATKQTLGVIGCLFILFNLMIRVNEQVILPLNLSALMLDRLQFVCQTMAIGLLATSALLHADEE